MQDPQTEGGIPPSDPIQSYPPQPYSPVSYAPNGHAQGPQYPPQTPYSPQAQYPPQPISASTEGGLSDTAAGALAYVTIIPAIVFLVLAPYNTRPFIRFHAMQCLGLAVFGFCLGLIAVIPVLGWIVWLLGSLALVVGWVMSIVKASQGSYLKLPVISDFASQQSGYPIV